MDSLENELDMAFKFPEILTYSNIKDTDIKTIAEIFYYCLSSEEQKKEYAMIIEIMTREFLNKLPKNNQDEVYKKFNDIISSNIKENEKTTLKTYNRLLDFQLENKLLEYIPNKYFDKKYIYTYKGQYNYLIAHGKGILHCYDEDDGDTLIWKYEGMFNNELFDKKGTITFENGNVYTGEFTDNEFQGNGIMTFKNGNKFEGTWKNNMFNEGTFTIKDKVYSGECIYFPKYDAGKCAATPVLYQGMNIHILINNKNYSYILTSLFNRIKYIQCTSWYNPAEPIINIARLQ